MSKGLELSGTRHCCLWCMELDSLEACVVTNYAVLDALYKNTYGTAYLKSLLGLPVVSMLAFGGLGQSIA